MGPLNKGWDIEICGMQRVPSPHRDFGFYHFISPMRFCIGQSHDVLYCMSTISNLKCN